MSGELEPGTKLRQIDWAERLGVSPTPVREAFTALAKQGLVRHDAQRGVVVFTPTVADVTENYEIRLALEPLATSLAAENMTDAEFTVLDAIVNDMKAADGPAYQELNRYFHRVIYAAARRPQLAEMIESLRDRFEVYVRLDIRAHPDPVYENNVQQQHEAIAAALHARSRALAHKMMHDHLISNRSHIAESVEIVLGSRSVDSVVAS